MTSLVIVHRGLSLTLTPQRPPLPLPHPSSSIPPSPPPGGPPLGPLSGIHHEHSGQAIVNPLTFRNNDNPVSRY